MCGICGLKRTVDDPAVAEKTGIWSTELAIVVEWRDGVLPWDMVDNLTSLL